MQDFIFSRS